MSRQEKFVLGACFLGCLVVLHLFFDSLVAHQQDDDALRSKLVFIGTLESNGGDTRLKTLTSFDWSETRGSTEIRSGDSIFTGKSGKAAVVLKGGGVLELSELSLVTFSDVDGLHLPKLESGTLHLKGDVPTQVMVNGQLVSVEGQDSDLQISVGEDNQARIELVKGGAKIRMADGSLQNLTAGQTLSLAPTVERQSDGGPDFQTGGNPRDVLYLWKLADLYEQKEGFLFPRETRPTEVNLPQELTWRGPAQQVMTTIQHSRDLAFAEDARSLQSVQGQITLPTVFLGENYWRLSADRRHWSRTQFFRVQPAFLPGFIRFSTDAKIISSANDFTIPLRVESESSLSAYVVEVSPDPDFQGSTDLLWVSASFSQIRWANAGTFYLRVRGVSRQQELTEWSAGQKVQLARPQLTDAPRAQQEQVVIEIEEPATLTFAPVARAKGYEVQIYREGLVLEKFETEKPQFQWQPRRPGSYGATLRAIDEWGQRGRSSEMVPIEVKVSEGRTPAVAR